MTRTPLVAPLATGVVLLVAVLALNGCAALRDRLHHESELTYPTSTRADGDWGPGDAPTWLPRRATDIRRLTTDDGTDQVVRLRTHGALPADCTTADRRQLPFDSRDWIPDVVRTTRVHRCGDWEVTAVHGGYLAWYSATSKGQLPEG